jgi:predicted DsbA family dithiol-disulfide isomerase
MQDSHENVLEVISDSICPWCYIGKRRLEGALKLLGGAAPRVLWKPFQLNPAMPVKGINRREYRSRKFGSWERSQQLDAQVRAAGEEAGIDFAHDKIQLTPNTLASHKLVLFATAADRTDPVVEGIFRAYFVEGRDIGDPNILAEIGFAAGLPRDDVLRALTDNQLTRSVLEEEARSRRFAAQGVPTFVFSGAPLASGAQPSELLAQLIAGQQEIPAGESCSIDGECQ